MCIMNIKIPSRIKITLTAPLCDIRDLSGIAADQKPSSSKLSDKPQNIWVWFRRKTHTERLENDLNQRSKTVELTAKW